VEVGGTEKAAAYASLPRDLIDRDLSGVRLMVSEGPFRNLVQSLSYPWVLEIPGVSAYLTPWSFHALQGSFAI
jgi:hypothetical protein